MIWNDMVQLFGAVLVIVAAVLPIVNPPGNAPIFLRLTAGCDNATRSELSRHIAMYAFALLLGSLLIGPFVLHFFDLEVAVIRVAGGAVVIVLGWRLLNDEPKESLEEIDAQKASRRARDRAFYPLTMPVTVDPGAIAVAVTLGVHHVDSVDKLVVQGLASVISAAIVALSVLLAYRYAKGFADRIGQQGIMIVMRLSAFIVLAIGVQITWNGVKALLLEIGLKG